MDMPTNSEAPAKKWPSSTKERRKERKRKMKEQGNYKRTSFEYGYHSDEEKNSISKRISRAKEIIGEGTETTVTNTEMLNKLLNFFLATHGKGEITQECNQTFVNVPSYQYIKREDCTKDKLFVGSVSALDNLLARSNYHRDFCSAPLKCKNTCMKGHVIDITFACEHDHNFDWKSSPHIEGGKYLVNVMMLHGLFVSGMLPNQYERLSNASGIGIITEKYEKEVSKQYRSITSELAQECMESALNEEIASTMEVNIDTENGHDISEGIDIMTDARYSTRRNAPFTDVISLGNICHKVVAAQTVSKKKDDPCTQRHENIGVKRTFEYFDQKQCPLRSVIHDDCGPTSKLIRERGDTIDDKDTWHATKGVAKKVKTICKGKAQVEGITWHSELSDKAAPLKTHAFWSMKYSGGDSEKLQSNLLNFVEHYKGNHTNCFESARCKTEGDQYRSTKIKITDKQAETILVNHIKGMKIYKKAEEYRHCRDTHYVESFNNALLQYQDKRIGAFNYATYRFHTELGILDWNEHVDRRFTSTRKVIDPKNKRRQVEKPVKVKKTYHFWDKLIARLLDYYYQ